MYYKICKAFEITKEIGINYDLYFRIRPDMKIVSKIDFFDIFEKLKEDFLIFTDTEINFKAGELRVGDQLAIGTKETMEIYSNTFIQNDLNCKKIMMNNNEFRGHQNLAIQLGINKLQAPGYKFNRGQTSETEFLEAVDIADALAKDLKENPDSLIAKRLYDAALKDVSKD